MSGSLRVFALTTVTMMAFAANSLLCRAALRGGAIDAASFSAIRLSSGAVVLLALLVLQSLRRENGRESIRETLQKSGSWEAALWLAAYATTFSYGYVRISTGAGALLQFGAVQLTMILGGIVRGEHPSPRQWLGLLVAVTGMVVINLPALDSPPPVGALLMISAGIAWGLYSLKGRGARHPVAVTTGNFVRSLPIAAALVMVSLSSSGPVTQRGSLLALASGALASGLGYSLWYAVLPSLGAARAAIVQLVVPVLAATGAVLLLDEPLRRHVAIGGTVVLGGLALALWRPPARS